MGTPGNDVIVGTPGGDVIFGNGGNDTICGGQGNDVIFGGEGNDTLYGDDGTSPTDPNALGGADSMFGDDGNDTMDGEAGADSVYGGANDDTQRGGVGNDSVFGEAGNDNLTGDAGKDSLDGGAGNDVLTGSAGDDSLAGPGRERHAERRPRADSARDARSGGEPGRLRRRSGHGHRGLLRGEEQHPVAPGSAATGYSGRRRLSPAAPRDCLLGHVRRATPPARVRRRWRPRPSRPHEHLAVRPQPRDPGADLAGDPAC